jgi:ABC-2 type transport system permease protein
MPIFDQGYQHWQGPLSKHGWRWLTIARHGFRVQMKSIIVRLLILSAWLPALFLVAFLALWGLVEQKNQTIMGFLQFLPLPILQEPKAYRQAIWTVAFSNFFFVQMYCILILVIVAGPGLISRDLRFNALPLYFARPLTRLDYFVGKLGVIAALVATVAIGPAVFAYFVGVIFSLDVGVAKDTYPVLLGSLAYGLVITLSAGTLMLALSSLTRRSLYVGIAFAGIWLISGTVGTIMTGISKDSLRRSVVDDEMTRWVQENPPPPGIQMRGAYPDVRWEQSTQKLKLRGVEAGQEEAGERWYNAWSQANQKAWADGQIRMAEAERENWWPVCSYANNLDRMGDALLDTDSAWVKIGKVIAIPQMPKGPRGGHAQPLEPLRTNDRQLADQRVWQFPWWWSAGVLVGLLGISTWTMTRRVKSLDRLK